MKSTNDIEERISRLHAGRLIDMHFDLPLSLFWNRARKDVIVTDFLAEFEAGDIGLLGVAVYIEDKYLPANALKVGLDQVALLYTELDDSSRFMLCKSLADIERARTEGRIGLMLTMEGVEPVG